MIDYLLACEISKETGEALSAAIGRLQGWRCECRLWPSSPGRFVRYGNRAESPGRCVLNNRIDLAADKAGALRRMRECGVRVPQVFGVFHEQQPAAYVLRASERSAQSDDPLVVPPGCVACLPSGHDHAVQWIDKVDEYRIHVMRGRPIRIQRRFSEAEADELFRGNKRGWKLRDSDYCPIGAVSQAVAAVRALLLDFGAADVVQDKDGKCWVLEVNTAPGLIPHGIDVYARSIVEYDQTLEDRL